MNLNQIINMVLRLVMRKAISRGIDAGINKMSSGPRKKTTPEQDPGSGQR